MKVFLNRAIAIFLIVVTMFFSVPANVFLVQAQEVENGVTDADIVGTNSVGELLSEAISYSDQQSAEESQNGIVSIVVEENNVEVNFYTVENANLVFTVFDNDDEEMLFNETQEVAATEKTCVFELDKESLPNYFLIKVFMLSETNTALCKPYIFKDFTKEYQEFFNKTVDDFDSNCVVEFDDKQEIFAVILEENTVVQTTDEQNIVSSNPNKEDEYIIQNPTNEIKNAEIGEVIYFKSNELDNDTVIKIKEITTDGDLVNIIADNIELKDVFTYIRIDATASPDENSFEDDENVKKVEKPATFSLTDKEGVIEDTYEWEKDIDGLNLKLELTLTTTLKFYYDHNIFGEDVVEIEFRNDISINGGFEFGLEFDFGNFSSIKLPIEYPIVPGVNFTLEVEPVLEAEFSMNVGIELNGTFGFSHKNSETTPVKSWDSNIDLAPNLDISGEFFIGLKFLSGVELAEVCDIQIGTKVGFKYESDLIYDDEDYVKHNCKFCFQIDKFFSVSFEFNVSFGLDALNKKYDFIKYPSREFKWHLDEFYFSDELGMGKGICPNKKFLVEIYVYRSKTDKTTPLGIKINEKSIIANPERQYFNSGEEQIYIFYKDEFIASKTIYVLEKKNVITIYLDDYIDDDDNDDDDDDNDIDDDNDKDDNEYKDNQCGPNAYWELTTSRELIFSGTGSVDGFTLENYYPWYCTETFTEITIGNGITHVPYDDLRCEKFNVEKDNQYYSTDKYGALYNKDKTVLYRFPSESTTTIYNAPESLERIVDDAFDYNKYLTEINLPDIALDFSIYAIDDSEWFEKQYHDAEYGSIIYLGKVAVAYDNEDNRWNEYPCEQIIIKDGTLAIARYAFSDCNDAQKIKIPGSVKEVGQYAFSSRANIKTAGPIGSGSDLEFGWKKEIPNNAFEDFEELQKVVIPNGIVNIGEDSFSGCSSLEDVSIPDSVENIGDSAFSYCNLKRINFSEGLKTIGSYAFYSNKNLSYVDIPRNVENIGWSAFVECDIKTAGPKGGGYDFEFSWIESLPETAFYGCVLTSIVLPDGLLDIKRFLLEPSYNLEYLYIPDSVKTMSGNVFENAEKLKTVGPKGGGYNIEYGWQEKIPDEAFCCSKITDVVFPETLTEIGNYAFAGTNISKLVLPSNLDCIGFGNFANCDNLITITIPGSIKVIEDNAFSSCLNLINVNISKGVTTVGDEAFLDCENLTYILLPESLVDFGENVFTGCTSLLSVGPKNSKCNIEYSWQEKIPDFAFYGSEITGVKFSETITEIGVSAFSNTNLSKLVLPSTLDYICTRAFSNCNNLTKVIFPRKMTTIGYASFENCSNLSYIDLPIIVNEIDSNAFSNTEIETLILPEQIKSMSQTAFSGCNNLKNIIIPENWDVYNGTHNEVFYYDSVEKIACHSKTFIDFPEDRNLAIYGYTDSKIAKLDELYDSYGLTAYNFYDINSCDHKNIRTSDSLEATCDWYGYTAGTMCADCGTWISGHKLIVPHKDSNDDGICDFCKEKSEIVSSGTCGSDMRWSLGYDGVVHISGTGDMGSQTLEYRAYNYRNFLPGIHLVVHEGVESINSTISDISYNFETISLPNTLKEIEELSISFEYLSELYIPENVQIIESTGIVSEWLLEISVNPNNNYFTSEEGILFNKEKSKILLYPSGKLDREYSIPDSVESVDGLAFLFSKFEKINIPDSVIEIGKGAFGGSWLLKDITIPEKVTTIESGLFVGGQNLKNITFLGHIVEVKEKDEFLGVGVFPEGVTVYGLSGTALEDYTKKNNIKFENFEMLQDKTNNYSNYVVRRSMPNSDMDNKATFVYENAVDGTEYVLLIVKNIEGESYLSADNLCYIDQKTAENGVVEFSYSSSIEGYELVFGLCDHKMEITEIDATCETDGESLARCVYCDFEKKEVLQALGHNFVSCKEKISTCEEPGYTAHEICSVCGDKFGYEEIPAINHKNATEHKQQDSTCTEIGYTVGKYCPDCELWIEGHDVIPTIDHSYTVSVTKEPTCTTSGEKTFTCVCGESYTEAIEKLGHSEVKVSGKAATCKSTGLSDGKKCSVCGTVTVEQQTIAKKAHTYTNSCDKSCNVCKATRSIKHTYKTYLKKATLSANGKDGKRCSVCGYITSTTKTVYYPKTFRLSTTAYTYNGKAKTPSVTVKDSKGNTLKKDRDYTVKYESGRKVPGKYTVTITFKGKYTGTKKLYFTIAPKAISKITATQTTTTITLKWNKVTGADGYRVYKYNSKTKKYEKLKDVKGTSLKISKLKADTAYKYKVRAYTKDDGTIWGIYSSAFETATKCKTPSIKKLTTTKGKASFTWSNVSGESGYEVYYSTKKDSGYKKVASYKTNVVKGSKNKLKSGKKYYFKVRAYKKTASGTVYSAWSPVKSVKVK